MQPSPTVLAGLKAIRRQRGQSFKSHAEFLTWSDSAEPLLAFNPELAKEFKDCVRSAKLLIGYQDGSKYTGATNEAIGTVNKAITLFEMK